MGFHNNGQTSLNNNKSLREKNRWKFEGSEYPMPETYINPEKGIDKERLKIAENNKTFRLVLKYTITVGIILSIFYFVFLIL